MGDLELCCECDTPTGRAGRAEDSLYHGDQGPFCEECFETAPEQWLNEATRLRAEKAELAEALRACSAVLGAAQYGGQTVSAGWDDGLNPDSIAAVNLRETVRALRAIDAALALARARETGENHG